ARQKERKSRLRPNEVRHITGAIRIWARGAIRQSQVTTHDIRLCSVVEFVILLQIRLHNAQADAGHIFRWVRPQPYGAVAAEHRKCNQSKNKRTVWMARVDLIVGDHCGTCANSDGEKCKAPDSGQRNGLREHERLGECVAKRIPGKPAEETTAQPFRGSHRGGERQNSFRAAYPDQPGDRKTKARVKRQISGQSGNGDRQKPAEGLGIDEKGVSDPINSSEEIPEAKTPAGHSGRDGAAPSSGGGSVHEPDQNWKCHEQNRPCVDGRHGQSRRGAGNECYACAPPAYGEHDGVSQAGKNQGWRTPAEPVSLRGDLSSGVVGEAVTLENMPSASLRLRASRCRSRLSFSRVIRTRLTRRGSASRT